MEISEYVKTPNYVKIKFRADTSDYHATLRKMELWCVETRCGKKVNHNTFAFQKDGDLMMFKLKWGTQINDSTGKFFG